MNQEKRPPVSDKFRKLFPQLEVSPRLLLGPGPSNAHPRVLQVMGMRQVGHLDPEYLHLMDEIQDLLRYAWQTENEQILTISGTGTAAMEASVANSVEPGDVVLVGVNGYFSERLCDMAARYGGQVRRIEKPWGQVFNLDELQAALAEHRPAVLALVHAETSTGAEQPLDGVGALCREFGCLLLIDSVTSLGGLPLFLDEWGVDVAYSGSQKCIGCPPGVAPFTMGARALEKLERRESPVTNWYLDLKLLSKYWGSQRAYHHTAPINMNYAFREALRLVAEEGLAVRWQRHRDNARLLWDGLADIGLHCYVDEPTRLPTLTTVGVPDGVDAKAVTNYLLHHYNIEIGNGLGQLAGKVWRVGLMGYNSRPENVVLLLGALERALAAVK